MFENESIEKEIELGSASFLEDFFEKEDKKLPSQTTSEEEYKKLQHQINLAQEQYQQYLQQYPENTQLQQIFVKFCRAQKVLLQNEDKPDLFATLINEYNSILTNTTAAFSSVQNKILQSEKSYKKYIVNIKSKVADLENYITTVENNKTIKSKSVENNDIPIIKQHIGHMKNKIYDFEKKFLYEKKSSLTSFQDNMLPDLNVINSKMRGKQYRDQLVPLLKHIAFACGVIFIPAVIVSLAYRAKTGNFLFFESRQAKVKATYDAIMENPEQPQAPQAAASSHFSLIFAAH